MSSRRVPGRPDMTMMRSPRMIASSMSWVTMSTVLRSASHRATSSSCMSMRVWASRAPSGSSMSSTGEPVAKARAIATRWRMPPES